MDRSIRVVKQIFRTYSGEGTHGGVTDSKHLFRFSNDDFPRVLLARSDHYSTNRSSQHPP